MPRAAKTATQAARVSPQNLGYAVGILSGATWTDLDDEDVSTTGYRSSRLGPSPTLIGTSSLNEAHDALATTVRTWVVDGEAPTAPETIGVLVRTRYLGDTLVRVLDENGLPARFVGDDSPPGPGRVLVMTMHRAKGMEFKKVVLFGLSNDDTVWVSDSGPVPDAERADADLRARSLLYVAATRARDELVVMWNGEPSELLPTVGTERTAAEARSSDTARDRRTAEAAPAG